MHTHRDLIKSDLREGWYTPHGATPLYVALQRVCGLSNIRQDDSAEPVQRKLLSIGGGCVWHVTVRSIYAGIDDCPPHGLRGTSSVPPTMSLRKSSAEATKPTAAVPLSTDFCADDADFIIRAAGILDFRVHKSILSLVSPIFKDMFSIPQPPPDTPHAPPRIDVQESARAWEIILQTIYPMPNPIIENLDDLESLLLAAKKYEMQYVIDSHAASFTHRPFLQDNPLRLYAIACACGSDDQAKYVARNAELLAVVRHAQDDGMNGLTLTSYHRLMNFLVERDNEFHPILERDWKSLLATNVGSYQRTWTELSKPYIQMGEVYLTALEDGSRLSGTPSAVGIRRFLERAFKERERVRDKFIWQ